MAIGAISSTSIVDVVARHDHLRAFRQRHDAGHVRRAEVELRTVVGEERRVTAALFLRQDVGLGLELRVRLDRTRLAQRPGRARRPSRFVPRSSSADVVAGLALVEQLAEHLDAGDRRLLRSGGCRRSRLPRRP